MTARQNQSLNVITYDWHNVFLFLKKYSNYIIKTAFFFLPLLYVFTLAKMLVSIQPKINFHCRTCNKSLIKQRMAYKLMKEWHICI